MGEMEITEPCLTWEHKLESTEMFEIGFFFWGGVSSDSCQKDVVWITECSFKAMLKYQEKATISILGLLACIFQTQFRCSKKYEKIKVVKKKDWRF